MKKKMRKRLNMAVTKEIKKFDIDKARLDNDFAFYYFDNVITFKLDSDDFEDKLFLDFAKERFNFVTDCPFIFFLLHEVGHSMTECDIVGAVNDFCLNERQRILDAVNDNPTEEEKIKLNFEYFGLPDEIMATSWAIDYMRNHPKKIKKMRKRLEDAGVVTK